MPMMLRLEPTGKNSRSNVSSRNKQFIPVAPISHLLFLLLLITALFVKNSEQRVLAKQGNSAMNPQVDDQGPEVVLPPFNYVLNADDELQIPASNTQRLADAEGKYMAQQLARAADFEDLRPRAQRWLLRTEALKEHPTIISASEMGSGELAAAVKRVVSESELNSLLKNAWLGRK